MPPLELLALIPASVVVVYLLWFLRLSSIRKQLRQPLRDVPLALVATWYDAVPDSARARWGKDAAESEGSEDPGLSTIEILFHLSRIERKQLATWQPPKVPTSFDEVVGEFDAPSGTRSEAHSDGGANSRVGARSAVSSNEELRHFAERHPGEQLLAEQLRQQGHDVQMVDPQQQPCQELAGWSAEVDGHEARLLASEEPGNVDAFLKARPDVHVVTVADHSEQFIDHALVLTLDQVTLAQIQQGQAVTAIASTNSNEISAEVVAVAVDEQASDAETTLAAISNVGNLVVRQAGNPLLTTAFRSAQLAASGDKDWLSAAKHGLADQAGPAMGGWAGARAGAIAGGFFGPLGAAAGGWLGGLLGKKMGASVATQQTHKKLKRLMAKQEGFLAALPAASRDALTAQAAHLQAVAKEIAPPSEKSLWPGPGLIARREVARQYFAWSKRVLTRAGKLDDWLKTKPAKSRLASRGQKLLQKGSLGWSRDLLELRAELLLLAPQIESEQQRIERIEAS